MSTKGKGDLAELKVACDLVERGHRVAVPFGEEWDFDLIVYHGRRLERIQVKHSASANGVLIVKCRSHSLTNGKIRRTKYYTSANIDWLAVYDSTIDRCFYILRANSAGAARCCT